ncbi:MAG: methanogenesis marker 17 protein [Hadesarchaea archaeon]|nr:methanogenesis marker 17 protein [Hadesarchaea archaeon]TDA29805.1 MAG: methanogenesis marker 17 protein [Hadesarchaea archaeon]
MSEKVFAESLDPSYQHGYGVLMSKVIAEHALSELGLGGAVEEMRILVDIRKPLFAVRVRLGPPLPPVRVRDCARVQEAPDGIHVVLLDEGQAPFLARLLRERFGKGGVEQLDRWEVVVPPGAVGAKELEEMVVSHPRERMMERIMDAVERVIPVGFRVGYAERGEDHLLLIASENPIKEGWVEEVREALRRPPSPVPPEKMEGIRRKVEAAEVQAKFKEGAMPWRL